MATTHYHHLERMIRDSSPDLRTVPYGFVFQEDDKISQYRAARGQPPGTSRGVQRAMYAVQHMHNLRNKVEVLQVFERAIERLGEIDPGNIALTTVSAR